MTAHRDLKNIIRDRQRKTGESYTTARLHVLRERDALLGADTTAGEVLEDANEGIRVEAAVLKVNERSARVRILGETPQLTFRSGDVWMVVPGHVVTLHIEKRWSWREDAYASGRIENPRIDVPKLALEPLPLEGGDLLDLREHYEAYRHPDPYAPLWRKLTERPRPEFEMHEIAWGDLPGHPPGASPVSDAAELMSAGENKRAREILMDVLCADLRCIDAHAHLGNLVFDRPEQAIVHYEIGVQIGELSLPPGFDGVLPWGHTENRPFLRALKGYGLCLWRLGKTSEAGAVFERVLSFNPNDNQGVRFCLRDVERGRSWEEAQEPEEREREKQLRRLRRTQASSMN